MDMEMVVGMVMAHLGRRWAGYASPQRAPIVSQSPDGPGVPLRRGRGHLAAELRQQLAVDFGGVGELGE